MFETGEENEEILSLGFDLEKWNKRNKQNLMTEQEKNEKIAKIRSIIESKLYQLFSSDPLTLFNENQDQFFALKKIVQSILVSKSGHLCSYYRQCHNLWKKIIQTLESNLEFIPISSLSLDNQKKILEFIFYHEQQIWRERGNRENETLQTYIGFATGKHQQILFLKKIIQKCVS